MNGTDLFTVIDSVISSNVNVNLSNVLAGTKINTKLNYVNFNKVGERIKTVTDNYVIDDTDRDMFHIDHGNSFGKTIEVYIHEKMNFGERELFFNRLNGHHSNKFQIKSKKLVTSDGTLLLPRPKSKLCLYQDDGSKLHVKYTN